MVTGGFICGEQAADHPDGHLEEVDVFLVAEGEGALDPIDRLGGVGVEAHEQQGVEGVDEREAHAVRNDPRGGDCLQLILAPCIRLIAEPGVRECLAHPALALHRRHPYSSRLYPSRSREVA